MNKDKLCYLVWTGCAWWQTSAVSEAKAMSNIEWRMRQMGKFPNRSLFVVKAKDEKTAGVQ